MKVVSLDRNESQYGPAPACYEALRNIAAEHLTQYTRDYDRGVKSRVSEVLAERLGVDERNVLLGYGAEWLLKMAIHRFLKPGETLLVPDASWWYYGAIAHEVGAKTSTYRVIESKIKFVYDAGEILSEYRKESPSVVLIASPNNPTGNSISPEVLNIVLSNMRSSTVIIDEAYWGFTSTDNSHVKEIVSRYDNVMILRSFSKYYGLAGLRLGYAVCSDRFSEFAKYTTLFLGYQQIAENVALAALDSPEYYNSIALKMAEDKRRFYVALSPLEGINCYVSDANFLLVRFEKELVDDLKIRLAAVGLKPKFFSEKRFENYMRLTLGTQEQNAIVLREILAAAALRTPGVYEPLAAI